MAKAKISEQHKEAIKASKGKKGFQKGNKLGLEGTRVREEKKEQIWGYVVGGGATKAKELVETLMDGEEIKPAQEKGLDYLLRFAPYAKPKLTSTDNRNEHSGELKVEWLKD